jgi:hypothetical protein
MPSLKRLDIQGNPVRDVNGKPIYDAIVEFRNRDVADRVTAEVLAALRRDHPEALEDAP